MIFYFEYRNNSSDKIKKFEITTNPYNGRLILASIDFPCNDRTVLATGDSVTELVEWTLQNF